MKNLLPILAVFAAFTGGVALADAAAPNAVRAQNFVLVDANNKTVGVFGTQQGKEGPLITLYDAQGRVLWFVDTAKGPIRPL